jgi:hypothetical protein
VTGPSERLRARRAALIRHAQTYGIEATAPARQAFLAGFLDQVPEHLPAEERERRARLLLRARMLELAELSAKARRKRSK